MAPKPQALAKLSRPRLHDVLPRERLFAQLDALLARPLVWLAAAPGAGKTTLVASYVEARRRAAVWYQVDAGDADPASFIYHLRLAAAGKAAAALPLLSPEYLHDLPGFARRFFRELFAQLGAGALLVFDNLHEVPDDASFHALLAEGLGQLPDGIGVIATSRVEPPPAYAGLLAAGALASLDGEAMRLALDETQAIAQRRGVDGDAAVQRLHARSNGWAAGLTLLLARPSQAAEAEADDPASLQHVFGYFAQRALAGISAEQQRMLMQLAFLPLCSADIAEQLTGRGDAGRLLERCHRRNLFIDRRRSGAVALYQFHALFRAFLQHRARAGLSVDELRDLLARGAGLLDAAGHWEQALALYADAGDWPAYARVVAGHAESLLAQGRRQTVVDWLARLPGAWRTSSPWLGYWEGRALMAAAPERALAAFDATRQVFADLGDTGGQLACGAAAVQTLWYARLGWSEIALRVDQLEPLLAGDVVFPSPAVDMLSFSAVHAALAFCRLAHPALPGVALRLLGLVDDDGIDFDQRLSTATHLITYFHNAAEFELATRLIAKVDGAVETLPASALNRAFWFIFRGIHDIRRAQYEAAAQRLRRAEELARQDGLAHAEFAAMHFRAFLGVLFRRGDEAAALLARLELHPARGHPDAEMNYCVVRTLLAQLRGDGTAALRHADQALAAIRAVGATYFQAVYTPLLASTLADGGRGDEALAIIAASRRIAEGNYLQAMQAQLLLEEAYVHQVRGDGGQALALLAQGLAAASDASRAAYAHRILPRKPVLLSLALQAGIEVDFVRRVIRDWQVPPPADDVPHWPWPVRVRTLGEFEVLLDDAPLAFGRKAPKKTLALLKFIAARGGSCADAAVVDTFWPDEEGDAAAKSLAAAVNRLRTLLGDSEAVVQQGGLLSLDRERVWLDVWAFERALGSGRHATDPATVLALYRGAFLAEEEGAAWPVAMRERLRGRFIQAVADQGARLEAAHRPDEAIVWYQRGLDADNVVEPFYQGLMRCFHRLDRLPEAVSAYRRLKLTLSVTLSLPPSAGTEALYRSLRLGG